MLAQGVSPQPRGVDITQDSPDSQSGLFQKLGTVRCLPVPIIAGAPSLSLRFLEGQGGGF